MPDVYATIASADDATLARLAATLELRAAEPGQRAMLADYTAALGLEEGARVLEVGCGTGAVSRYLTGLPGVSEVVGIDPSPYFVERARELGAGLPVTFAVGDARALELPDASFDAVVFHTALSHVPEPQLAIGEALRVLRPGGSVAAFDGDYATTTVATSGEDPLQACAEAAVAYLVHDPWLVRRLVPLLQEAGFASCRIQGHAYTTTGSDYMLSLVTRGADWLAESGRLAVGTADALKAEASNRVDAGTFFGHIAYASVIARRP